MTSAEFFPAYSLGLVLSAVRLLLLGRRKHYVCLVEHVIVPSAVSVSFDGALM